MKDAELCAFETEISCTYRGEVYRVRDNGAVLRVRRKVGRKRPLDGAWTFGAASPSDGYMSISGHKVHRIVATAFHGEQPSANHVVDHIDTNRRNNRVENLRWVTRLENVLLNPITAKRIIALYGSIEEFLANPRNPKNGSITTDFQWMRTVSSDEAEYSRHRLLAWAQSDRRSSGGTIGDWIFSRSTESTTREQPKALIESKTPGAVQRNWQVPAEFPLCPSTGGQASLTVYRDRLKEGEIAVISPFGVTKVCKAETSQNQSELFMLGTQGEGSVKPWSLVRISIEGAQFVHESMGTFFTQDGAEKELALALGLAWEGGETFDDWC